MAATLDDGTPLDEASDVIMAEIDGRPVPAEIWTATPLPPGSALALTALPRGRTFWQIVVVAAAIAASFIPGIGQYVSAAILIGGNVAINALFPPPVPPGPGPAPAGPERYVASTAGNRARPYGRRTLVLGRMRFAPDLATRQLLAPTAVARAAEEGADDVVTDHTVTIPGAVEAETAPRLDRVMLLDLGVGSLAVWPDEGGPVTLAAGARTIPAAGLVDADSVALAPEYAVGPGGALAPPAGLRGSTAWPLRCRALHESGETLSGAEVAVDATRTASRLLVVIGGNLYSSNDRGALVERTANIALTGSAEGEADIAVSLQLANNTLSPEYVGIELVGGQRGWRLAGGDRSVSTRGRAELSVLGSYWLAPLADLAARSLPTTLYGVRIAGQIGAPPRRVLRVEAAQIVPVPGAKLVWGAPAPSRNPAAILRAFALGWHDGDGLLIAGSGRHPDTIDHANLARFHARCEDHDPPLRCDFALQNDSRPAEAIERLIAATGRAEISWASGRLGAVWAEPGDAPQGLIAPAQILPGTLAQRWRRDPPPDTIVASYLDRDGWDAREIRVAVPGGGPRAGGGRERQVQFEGVTERATAAFHLACLAADEAYHRRVVTWRTGREGAAMMRGSLWWMAADLLSGGVTGRLREYGAERVRLDRPVRLGARPWIAIDAPGGGLHRSAVLPVDGAGAGETDLLTLVQPVPGFAASDVARPRDAVWRIYDYARPPRPVRILFNRPVSETEFELAARDESPEYWEFIDSYRAAPAAPPRIDLPDHAEIPETGVWAWPAAWTEAGIAQAALIVLGGGGGEQGGIGRSEFYESKSGTYSRHYSGGLGGDGWGSRVTLAGGTRVTARGGRGGGRGVADHNARGAPGGSGGVSYQRVGSRVTGGQDGQAGEHVGATIVAGDTPLAIVVGPGGAGGVGTAGNVSTGANGAAGADGWALIYPLPP